MINWDLEIKKLKQFVFVNNISYEEIGKLYNCSGANIKKVMRKRGIDLPIRSKNSGKTPHNKGTGKKYFCLNCGALIEHSKNTKHKYCSNSCQQEYEYKLWVEKYKEDNSIAINTKWGQIPGYLRRYIFEKFQSKCSLCGWSETNPYTNTIPLEVDHIDGNADNNSEENLRLICPNCHSLTSTYRGANRGKGRNITWTIKK
jgi:5-methylcytosine-specific restriction endonuclease McrA